MLACFNRLSRGRVNCRRMRVALRIKFHSFNSGDDSCGAEQECKPIVGCPVCKVGCMRPVEHLWPQQRRPRGMSLDSCQQ